MLSRSGAAVVALLLAVVVSAVGQGVKTKTPPTGAAKSAPQPTWVRTSIGSSEMSAEFPGEAKKTPIPLESKVRAGYDILETVGYSSPSFAASASYAVLKSQTPINLNVAARGALDNVKGQVASEDYKETITNTTILGLPGRKLQCSFTSGGRRIFLLGVIFSDRSRMWQVICTGEASAANTATATRVVASIKRAAPGLRDE